MGVRPAVEQIGHNSLDIAAGVRIHNFKCTHRVCRALCPFLVFLLIPTALTFAHATPNAETLIMVDGPFQALLTNLALGAHSLGIPG